MNGVLLTREGFKKKVFERDNGQCVVCHKPAVDAHHILERRLFSDGGYYLDNGVALCGECHFLAEQTHISCEALRKYAGITNVVLPPQFEIGERLDKWGNPVLANGTRLRGELFYDESVQKVLSGFLNEFSDRVKYPRTYHVPWSPGATSDDKTMSSIAGLGAAEEVVVTVKMDGENTTMYRDYIHARSLDYSPHESRNYVKSLWAAVSSEIPEGWRVTGENMYARHSLSYDALPGYFLVFGVWNNKNVALSWDDTVLWAGLLGLPTVPVVWRGNMADFDSSLVIEGHEGYVIRDAGPIPYGHWRDKAGKWVRANHVVTDSHWMHGKVTVNKLA